jgi:hypothetical protein
VRFSRSWYGSPGWTILGLVAIPVIVLATSYWITFNMPDLSSTCATGDQTTESELFEPGLDVVEGLSILWAGLIYWLLLQYQFVFGKPRAPAIRQVLSLGSTLVLFMALLAIYFFLSPDCLKTASGATSETSVGPSFAPGNLISNNFWVERGIELVLASLAGIQAVHWLRFAHLRAIGIAASQG